MTNITLITMKNFGQIVSFVYAKPLLEPMWPLVTFLEGQFFGFENIVEKTQINKETRENADELFQLVYVEAVTFPIEFGTEEIWSQSCEEQMSCKNIPSETVKVKKRKEDILQLRKELRKEDILQTMCVHEIRYTRSTSV